MHERLAKAVCITALRFEKDLQHLHGVGREDMNQKVGVDTEGYKQDTHMA
jgi:hypothetical protein